MIAVQHEDAKCTGEVRCPLLVDGTDQGIDRQIILPGELAESLPEFHFKGDARAMSGDGDGTFHDADEAGPAAGLRDGWLESQDMFDKHMDRDADQDRPRGPIDDALGPGLVEEFSDPVGGKCKG